MLVAPAAAKTYRVPSMSAVRAELARRSLIDFTLYTLPTYQAGWFHREVAAKLDRFLDDVLARRSPRLMLFAPPRSGKSELVSRRFPAFAFGRAPDLSMISTSYSGELSSRLNRDVQRVIDDPTYADVFPGTSLNSANVRTIARSKALRNSDIFEIVGHRGVYRSAGVMGSITGMGADILVIDDPVKDAIEADSEVYRDRAWEWYSTTAYTRLAPGGGVLLIMTRWHEDDLAGRILMAAQEGGDAWDVARYPAIAEADEPNRKAGEALHPARYDVAAFAKIRAAVGSRSWAALYQQRPAAAEGIIFKREHWRYYQSTSEDRATLIAQLGINRVLQAWDTAFKRDEDNDPSVGITIGVAPTRYYVLDLWRGKVEYPELKRIVQAQAAKWSPYVLLVEDAASGQSLTQELKRNTRLPVIPVRPDRDKVARANAITPHLEAGLVYLPERAPWVADFMDECAAFPNALHDDQVDALTLGLGYVVGGGGGLGLWEYMRAQAENATVAPVTRAGEGG